MKCPTAVGSAFICANASSTSSGIWHPAGKKSPDTARQIARHPERTPDDSEPSSSRLAILFFRKSVHFARHDFLDATHTVRHQFFDAAFRGNALDDAARKLQTLALGQSEDCFGKLIGRHTQSITDRQFASKRRFRRPLRHLRVEALA